MNTREQVYRGWVAQLACAIYNDEEWDKQTVASLLHLGDKGLDYTFPGDPPERLEQEDFFAAIDRIFDRAGI